VFGVGREVETEFVGVTLGRPTSITILRILVPNGRTPETQHVVTNTLEIVLMRIYELLCMYYNSDNLKNVLGTV